MSFEEQLTPYGMLPSNLRVCRLGDLCVENGIQTGPFGSQLHKEDYAAEGTPILTVEHLGDNRIIHNKLPLVSDNDKARLIKFTLKAGDIVFSRVGSVDRRALVQKSEDGWLFSGRCLRVRPDIAKIDPHWLSHFLGLPAFKSFIRGVAVGATMPSINTKILSDILIYYPSLAIQKKNAKLLTAIENKISCNQKVNQILEQMAQALFKSWFVDFEPVKAKIAVLEAGGSQEDATLAAMTVISGKAVDALMVFEHEHPEQYAELKAMAELFPSAMQESELGEIPEAWHHGPLSNIATFANGKVDVCSLTPETYISTENMLENRAGISTASSLPSTNSVPEFRFGHVLISNIRPYFKKIWLARFKGGRSADVLAFETLGSVTIEYVYNLLYQETFFNFMMQTSKGVKMPRGDKKSIMGWQCIHPDKKISNAFSKAVGEYYSFIEINNAQNKTLTQLRDTLLPKLLSGEITLPETEQAVSEVENV